LASEKAKTERGKIVLSFPEKATETFYTNYYANVVKNN